MPSIRQSLRAGFAAAALLAACAFSVSVRAAEEAEMPERRPVIQIAILLDTSGSMQGLIDQARSHLWSIVNEFATARLDGVRPELHVALYEYGKSSLPAEEGYVRLIVPLSDDLDRVSQELFALTTQGGDEYCGWVIRDATRDLAWSASNADFKAIFIAGNEPFTQGTVDYREACAAAIAKGIVVNTIHCGAEQEGVDTMWRDGATLADGSFVSIDHNQVAPQIDAPQDQELADLSVQLNATYVAYGAAGEERYEMQAEQDRNAASVAPAASAARAQAKASSFYRNDAWDLVDGVVNEKIKLADVKAEELPEEMRNLTLKERQAFLDQKLAQRKQLQEKVKQLSDARKLYIDEKVKELAANNQDAPTLEQAIVQTVREQANKKGYEFE
jgi:hypothetical protein